MHNKKISDTQWLIGKNKDFVIQHCNTHNIYYSIAELDAKSGINYDTELVVRANLRDNILHIVIGKFKLNV